MTSIMHCWNVDEQHLPLLQEKQRIDEVTKLIETQIFPLDCLE